MHITSCGRGLHQRELKGVEFLKKSLPNNWFSFANLDLVLDLGRAREVDLVIISDRRIFLVDLKDWYGLIESREGKWFLDGNERDPSPVAKVTGIARDLYPLLKEALQKRPETRDHPVPRIEGLVVLTGKADRSGIVETEKAKVLTDREFVQKVATDKAERESFGNVAEQFLVEPLTGQFWKSRLTVFFNAGPHSPFKPGRRRFQRFLAGDTATFPHPADIYREYDAEEEGVANSLGTLRLWNFGACPEGRFQTHEGRLEIAGREREVYHWLRDRGDDLDLTLLSPRAEDPERGVHYWEIYDRRRRLKRLSDFLAIEKADTGARIELSRQLLAAVAALHRNDAAHLDLGAHSIWLEAPTTVRLSHLLAARFPEVRSLGASRYQFLASVSLPEDILGGDQGPKRRDVFLLGAAIHHLLFGRPPEGDPAEWKPDVDAGGEFEALHHWFAQALELDAGNRFADATAALEAFNRAAATRPTPVEVAAGLEFYRVNYKSQRSLATAYPAIGEADETDSRDTWRSSRLGEPVLLKMWKPAAWGDIRREGPRVLAFLQMAETLKVDRLVGLPAIHEVLWLGDAIAVVQEWIDGSSLEEFIMNPPPDQSPRRALTFVRGLVDTVDRLHERGFGHGDLNPANIVVRPDGQAVLIDPVDFSSAAEGDKITSAYAPETGNRFERDRYAVSMIAEQIFAVTGLELEEAGPLAIAISDCREKVPKLSTLQPLLEEIDAALDRLVKREQGVPEPVRAKLVLSIIGAESGPIAPDEGMLFIRFLNDPERGTRKLSIRGSIEEIEIRLDAKGAPLGASRRNLDQGRIARIARYEFHKINSEIVVDRGDITELSAIIPLLSDPIVREKIAEGAPAEEEQRSAELDEEKVEVPSDEEAEDILAEEIAFSQAAQDVESVDVRRLWRALIDVENELTIEGVAERDSFYDRTIGRHRVPIQLESGAFDFSLTDRVGVERQDRRGWRRIGELDVQKSRPDMAAIVPSEGGAPSRTGLVWAGQRLRFVSHFEVQSLRRRTDAVDRILAGDGRTKDLLSVFDPSSHATPIKLDHRINRDDLADYELNDDQHAAFEKIVQVRPVGLVQGPPGTGKTRFIAGLAHYAITKGLAKNVLLSSQSHEAVNTAAEAVLKLFQKSHLQPNILRIAVNEDVVSDGLQPFYTARVEQALKDRFRASFKDRLAIVGKSFGLPDEIASMVVTVEGAVRPVVAKLIELKTASNFDLQRYNGLVETLRTHLKHLGIEQSDFEAEGHSWEGFTQSVVKQAIEAASRSYSVNADQVSRLFAAAAIGSDFVGSISRGQRSFEPFFAGTRQIVVGTCVGLGRTALGVTATPFDLVIVDEAARCTSSELLVPLQVANWAVLVGDHAQLEPHHEVEVIKRVAKSTGIDKREIRRSDFERVFSTSYGKAAGAPLKRQYRMLPPIGKLVSAVFYQDLKLEHGRTEPEIDPAVLPPGLELPLSWIETDKFGDAAFERRIAEGSSRINQTEASAIVASLERWCGHEPFRDWLTTQTKHAAGIGVICMYAAQRDLVRRTLMRSSLGHLVGRHIKIGTVDSYQGKENPITVVSLVRNNEDGGREGEVKMIKEGFLTTPNRINVAISRAMDRLIIVGARSRWRTGGPVGRLSVAFGDLVKDNEALEVGIEDILGSGRVEMGNKPRKARKSKTKKDADK